MVAAVPPSKLSTAASWKKADDAGLDLESCRHKCGDLRKSPHRCELVDYHSLPDYLKHNEFILSYYRSDWPLKETLLSVFSVHNETINVWTHLIGFFLFLALTFAACSVVQRNPPVQGHVPARVNSTAGVPEFQGVGGGRNASGSYWSNQTIGHLVGHPHNHTGTPEGGVAATTTEPVTRWPFLAFMAGAMVCLLTSSACHLLGCHSEGCCYVMLRLDYAGICALIVTSFYPLAYYVFLCDPFFQRLYISSITLFGIATALVALLPPFEAPEFRVARTSLFCCMALSGLVPMLHKLALYGDRPEAVLATTYETWMACFYALGAVVYVARVPERWLPGWFDLAGHSHQLFHILVLAGAYMYYLAGLVYLDWRDRDNTCHVFS